MYVGLYMARKCIRVYFTPPQYAILQDLAKKSGFPESELLRMSFFYFAPDLRLLLRASRRERREGRVKPE